MRKRQKTVSGAQVSFEGNGASGDENKFNLFNEILNIFSFNNFFEKKATFLEKMEEKIFGVHDHFFRRRGHLS